MMQAHSFFIGGVPMIFYGDEAGYTNDYSYLDDPGKNYDNRWMHRPVIDWEKNKNIDIAGTIEQKVFSATQKLIGIRRQLPEVADYKNLDWLSPHNIHVAGYLRSYQGKRLFCIFNFSAQTAHLTWYLFKEYGNPPAQLYDYWQGQLHVVGPDHEYLEIAPYSFFLLEAG